MARSTVERPGSRSFKLNAKATRSIDAFRFDVDDRCRTWRVVDYQSLSPPGSDHQGDTPGPCRKHVGEGNEFEHERRQEQRVESKKPRDQEGSDDVRRFIEPYPSEWAQYQLHHVSGYRNRVRSANGG